MYISIDAGGTNIRIAVFEDKNAKEIYKQVKFATENNYEIDVQHIVDHIKQFNIEHIEGIVVGIPCNFDADSGIYKCPNVSNWEGRSLKKDLESIFGCSVSCENDTTLGAIGQAYFANPSHQDFIFIIWGTGIGATYVKNIGTSEDPHYRVQRSEPYYQIIEWENNEKPIRLGLKVGGSGIVKKYQKPASELTEEEWGIVQKDLTQGFINILSVLPQVAKIYFGGGIALHQPDRIRQIRELCIQHFRLYPMPDFEITTLGDDAALWGGFRLRYPLSLKLQRDSASSE